MTAFTRGLSGLAALLNRFQSVRWFTLPYESRSRMGGDGVCVLAGGCTLCGVPADGVSGHRGGHDDHHVRWQVKGGASNQPVSVCMTTVGIQILRPCSVGHGCQETISQSQTSGL